VSGMGSDVDPVFIICYRLLADRAVGIAALVVTCKVGMYSHMAFSALFQGLSIRYGECRISTLSFSLDFKIDLVAVVKEPDLCSTLDTGLRCNSPRFSFCIAI
jgi:hypothetical protein